MFSFQSDVIASPTTGFTPVIDVESRLPVVPPALIPSTTKPKSTTTPSTTTKTTKPTKTVKTTKAITIATYTTRKIEENTEISKITNIDHVEMSVATVPTPPVEVSTVAPTSKGVGTIPGGAVSGTTTGIGNKADSVLNPDDTIKIPMKNNGDGKFRIDSIKILRC